MLIVSSYTRVYVTEVRGSGIDALQLPSGFHVRRHFRFRLRREDRFLRQRGAAPIQRRHHSTGEHEQTRKYHRRRLPGLIDSAL